MDPITALQVAGTIVSFTDFGWKLLSTASDIYRSANGTITANEEFEFAVTQISMVASTLSHSMALSPDLQAICAKTNALAKELLERLQSLKVNGGKRRAWKSLQKAVETAWSRDEITSLRARLASLRETLDTWTIASLRESVTLMSVQNSHRFDELDKYTQEILQALITNQETTSAYSDETSLQLRAILQMLSSIVVNDSNNQRPVSTVARLPGSYHALEAGSTHNPQLDRAVRPNDGEAWIREEANRHILWSLQFSSMTYRYDQIPKAHSKTFDWLFESGLEKVLPGSDFVKWLSAESTGDSDGVYWMNGKAGSGKSTLMRYICDDPRTNKLLRKWADASGVPLYTASYFFWNSGTVDQRTQEGFLRALLHQVLSEHTNLIPIVAPSDWMRAYVFQSDRNYMGSRDDWNLGTLLAAFDRLVTQKIVPIRICFFIDGLDEFDGDHEELCELVIQASRLKDVKICVSSRPWVVFNETFETFPKLRLQDLTYGDIKLYLQDKIENHARFRRLSQQEPDQTSQLISNITDRADGVFLWVAIVVKSLLQGFRNHDEIQDLQWRLREYPKDLTPLFNKMFGRIEAIYRESSSQIFQIFRAYRSHASSFQAQLSETDFNGKEKSLLSAVSLYYAARFHTDEDCISRRGLPSIEACSSSMEVQLTARCAGFLEIIRPKHNPQGQVEYFHRTAREFIESAEVWDDLLSHNTNTEFEADTALLRSYICQLQDIQLNKIGSESWDHNYLSSVAMLHAHFADIATDDPRTKLLNHMDSVVRDLEQRFPAKSNDRGSRFRSIEVSVLAGGYPDAVPDSFLAYAIQWDLAAYVAATLNSAKSKASIRTALPLIQYIAHRDARNIPWIHGLSPRTGKLLLKMDHGPNWRYNGSSIWERVLDACHYTLWKVANEDLRRYQLDVVELVQEFVEAGADLETNDHDDGNIFERLTALFEEEWKLPKSATHELLEDIDKRIRAKDVKKLEGRV